MDKKEPNLQSLLTHGYFPREIPPPFTTTNYSRLVSSNINTLPGYFTEISQTGNLVDYSVSRVGISRRHIRIPNPILYFNLCSTIINNWNELIEVASESEISLSKPVITGVWERYINPQYSYKDVENKKANIRSTSKFILKTDISRYYTSIYTHSIPWAIHTKQFAKVNFGTQHLGNSIDKWVRNGQDRQTVGIPIGPDSSFLIAEIIASKIDETLINQHQLTNGLRYVDDFEFGFNRYSEAEEALSKIQESLQDYELELNLDKTEIIQLPIPIIPLWVSELSDYIFQEKTSTQGTDILRYFSRAFDLSKKFPHEAVLKYAIRRLQSVEIHDDNWTLLEDLLLQCLSVETSTVVPVLEVLLGFEKKLGISINLDKIEEILNHQIEYHCPLGHSGEVAWSIWALIFWKRNIYKESAEIVSKMNDSVVALLTLDAQEKGLVPQGIDTTIWESFMTELDLHDKQWLLSYEARQKKWLPSKDCSNHIDKNESFKYLYDNNIEFYDVTKSDTLIRTPFY